MANPVTSNSNNTFNYDYRIPEKYRDVLSGGCALENPVSLVPCMHKLGKQNAELYFKTHKQCPLCSKEVTAMYPDPVMKELVERKMGKLREKAAAQKALSAANRSKSVFAWCKPLKLPIVTTSIAATASILLPGAKGALSREQAQEEKGIGRVLLYRPGLGLGLSLVFSVEYGLAFGRALGAEGFTSVKQEQALAHYTIMTICNAEEIVEFIRGVCGLSHDDVTNFVEEQSDCFNENKRGQMYEILFANDNYHAQVASTYTTAVNHSPASPAMRKLKAPVLSTKGKGPVSYIAAKRSLEATASQLIAGGPSLEDARAKKGIPHALLGNNGLELFFSDAKYAQALRTALVIEKQLQTTTFRMSVMFSGYNACVDIRDEAEIIEFMMDVCKLSSEDVCAFAENGGPLGKRIQHILC